MGVRTRQAIACQGKIINAAVLKISQADFVVMIRDHSAEAQGARPELMATTKSYMDPFFWHERLQFLFVRDMDTLRRHGEELHLLSRVILRIVCSPASLAAEADAHPLRFASEWLLGDPGGSQRDLVVLVLVEFDNLGTALDSDAIKEQFAA